MSNNTVRISKEALDRQKDFALKVRDMHPRQKSYFVHSFGCQLNDHDAELIRAGLENLGFVREEDPEAADFVVYNTCSVRENADLKFFGRLGTLKQKKAENPDLRIAVCGCMMKIEENVEKIRQSYPYVDLIFGPEDIYMLPELCYELFSGSKRVFQIGDRDVICEGLPVIHERKFRALVTIMYGCNNFCTYCIVPYTRGRERSRESELIVREIQKLDEEGFSEIMLLGQNVNSYFSPSDKIGFPELLEKICRETKIPRIRFMTSHPKDISPELLKIIAGEERIERHLHLPVQSGSNRILKLMNRSYTREAFMKTVHEARRLIPDISITTDIIVGYPGESEADFQDTLDLVKEAEFDSAFTFQYSPRKGTPAALLDGRIDDKTMAERFQRLLAIQNENSLRSNMSRLGKNVKVLIEGVSSHDSSKFTGRGSDFHLINFRIPEKIKDSSGLSGLSGYEIGKRLEGSFADVLITEAKTFSLEAEAVKL